MKRPDLLVERNQRTPAGALPAHIVQQIRSKLMNRGFVLLPSDTCYSLGMYATQHGAHKVINKILDRAKEPISLAFPSYHAVKPFVHIDPIASILLERFCPGPITVVCKAADNLPPEFFANTIASKKRTIGVRIPDSIVERDVAGSSGYPLTSVAIRDPRTKQPICNFDHALQIVATGIEKIGEVGWSAVEGDWFYHTHSTVVESLGNGGPVRLLRQGAIPFEDIQQAAKHLSGHVMEDWD